MADLDHEEALGMAEDRVWIAPTVRYNGTPVKGHWRSRRRQWTYGDWCQNGHELTPESTRWYQGRLTCIPCWERRDAYVSCGDCGDRFLDEETYDAHFNRESERRRGPDGRVEQGATIGCKSHEERRAIGMAGGQKTWHWKRCRKCGRKVNPTSSGMGMSLCTIHRRKYFRDAMREWRGEHNQDRMEAWRARLSEDMKVKWADPEWKQRQVQAVWEGRWGKRRAG